MNPALREFPESCRIRVLSRSRARVARATAREFASVDFLQPLENSRAAREFSGNLPENSFTGSGQYWNSGIGTVLEFPMILIIPNLGPCTYLPSSRTLYENPGHAEPVSWRSVHRNPVA